MASSSALQLADLALTWSNVTGNADLSKIDDDLASDRGLVTAVILSLFADSRAENDDVPPSGDETDRRGWWGDEFADVEGDRIGSRLWLLDRAKRTNEAVLRAKQYVLEALQWMLDDSVVEEIEVTASTDGAALLESVTLHRPGKDPVTLRFGAVWDHVEEDA